MSPTTHGLLLLPHHHSDHTPVSSDSARGPYLSSQPQRTALTLTQQAPTALLFGREPSGRCYTHFQGLLSTFSTHNGREGGVRAPAPTERHRSTEIDPGVTCSSRQCYCSTHTPTHLLSSHCEVLPRWLLKGTACQLWRSLFLFLFIFIIFIYAVFDCQEN